MTAPLAPRPEALDFLLTRRSRPAKTLGADGPPRETVETILRAGLRVPDHGKLAPWRFLVLEAPARARLAETVKRRGAERGLDPAAAAKEASAFEQGALTIAVVAAPKPSGKIPEWEQLLSAGCACMAVLNAALASGWGANWLSGWTATDRPFLREALGLEAPDFVAGWVHVGAETVVAPERPRPALEEVATWVPT